MTNCCCNLLSNLMARIIYTVVIGGLITIVALLCADVGDITGCFYKGLYNTSKSYIGAVAQVTAPKGLKTPIFGIKYSGYQQQLTLTESVKCIAYLKTKEEAFYIGSIIKYVPTDDQKVISAEGMPPFNCEELSSYDYTSKGWYFYGLDLTLFWSVVIICGILGIILVFMWLCCFGWCSCHCCAICLLCSSPKQQSAVVEVHYV